MKVIREVDRKNPVGCDECGRSVAITYSVRGECQNQDESLMLCINCLRKLQAGTIRYQQLEGTST